MTYTNQPGEVAGSTEVQLNFASALPVDTYTLDILDKLESDDGNALDGLVTTTDTGTDTIVLPSGNGTPGSGAFSAQFVVQTAPAVTGLALASGSDSGVAATAATLTDNVTNVVRPTLTGMAPETSTINIYSGSTSGQLLGTTTVPGSNPDLTATWTVTLGTSLNDPSVSSTTDGERTLVAQAVNTSGIAGTADALDVFVNTAAPTVSSVTFASNGQSVTSATSGPTPSTTGLDITFTDATASANATVVGTFNPDFAAVDSSFFSSASNYFSLAGASGGAITIATGTFTNPPTAAIGTSEVQLDFADPLPDDTYTLTIADSLENSAGTALGRPWHRGCRQRQLHGHVHRAGRPGSGHAVDRGNPDLRFEFRLGGHQYGSADCRPEGHRHGLRGSLR